MRKIIKNRRLFLLGAIPCASAFLSYFVRLLFSLNPSLTERVYSQGIYPPLAKFFSFLSGSFPFSVSEILVLTLPLLLVALVVCMIKKRFDWRRLLAGILAACGCAYTVFTLGWGINYERLPYAHIASLPVQASSSQELQSLCMSLAEDANLLRSRLSTEPTAYHSRESVRQTLSRVQAAYETASASSPWLSGRFANPKPALLSLPLAYMNIAGIYSPFTFEAHVNALESDLLLPATACHEAAHLRGFAREDEANFIAYIVCRDSKDVRFAYAGSLLALIHAGNKLYAADRQAFATVYAFYSPGVAADLKAYNENWAPYDGKAAEVQEKMNNAYLKSNGQADGVRSYGRMVDLLLAEKRKREGSALS